MSRLTMNEAVEYLKGVGFKDSASAPFYPFYKEGSEYKKALDTLVKELQHYKDLEEQGRLIEQKHGYWTGPDGYDCSECGENYMEVADADAYASGWKPNYCPNCGAKMEGSKW